MYEVKTYQPDCVNAETQVSFRLANRDWLKLEQSKEWINFRERLEKLQRKNNKI